MPKPFDGKPDDKPDDPWEAHRRQVIGLGENSFRKTYYPELRRNVANVKNLVLAVEQSPRGILITVRNGCIEDANGLLQKLVGLRNEELVGKTPQVLWALVSKGDPWALVAEQMAAGLPWSGDLFLTSGSGERRWVSVSIVPVHDDTGDITHFLGSMEDISARKQAEEELKAIALARTQALAAAEHLSALKSEFIANMSHELRTPIFQILGLARLGERVSDIERARLQAQKIKESGDRLMQIVETLLDFSAVESGQLELHPADFPLQEMVDSLAEKWLDKAAAKGLAFIVETIPPELPVIHADRQRLQQLLDELLNNAVKFTTQGEIRLTASISPGALALSVADTGIGMTAEQSAKCLQAFVQADGSATRRFGGMGLGLALVTHLVELMHGQIVAESIPGKGTTFRIAMPLTAS